jgi:hypothetical protein
VAESPIGGSLIRPLARGERSPTNQMNTSPAHHGHSLLPAPVTFTSDRFVVLPSVLDASLDPN